MYSTRASLVFSSPILLSPGAQKTTPGGEAGTSMIVLADPRHEEGQGSYVRHRTYLSERESYKGVGVADWLEQTVLHRSAPPGVRSVPCQRPLFCISLNRLPDHTGIKCMEITTANITTGYQQADRPWQVIFKTFDRCNYCRGTLPAERTEADVRRWALDQCGVHGLAYAVIERW